MFLQKHAPASRGCLRLGRNFYLGPIAEVAQGGLAGATGVESGAHIEETAKHVVLHPGDFCRLLCALPVLARNPEVEIDFLPIIDDAQSSAGRSFLLAAGDIAVSQPHADAVRVEQNSRRMVGVVEKEQPGFATRFDLDVDLDSV